MNNKAQFTPGPWKAERDTARSAYAWKITGAKGVVEDIARLALVDSFSQIEANATLIAAAPAMYEALKALVDIFPSVVKMIPYGVSMDISKLHDKAKAALAQAEGR